MVMYGPGDEEVRWLCVCVRALVRLAIHWRFVRPPTSVLFVRPTMGSCSFLHFSTPPPLPTPTHKHTQVIFTGMMVVLGSHGIPGRGDSVVGGGGGGRGGEGGGEGVSGLKKLG